MKRCPHIAFSFGTLVLLSALFISSIFLPGCEKKDPKPEEGMPKKWVAQLPNTVYYCSPALSRDEKTVYIGTSGFSEIKSPQFFVALEATTGKESWRLPLGISEFRSTPVVSPDGSIYFTVETRAPHTGIIVGDELWRVSKEGNLFWTYDINPGKLTIDVGMSIPAIGCDGTIYVGGDQLYAVNPDGSLRWTFSSQFPEAIRNAPVIGKDGTVYIVFHNLPLTALDPTNGSVKWSLPLGVNDHCFSSPAIGADGSLYVAQLPGLLFAISSDGQPIWTFDLASVGFSGTFRSSPSIGADGSIYLGLNDGSPSSAFFAINPNGTLKWIFEPADLPDNVPNDHFDIYSSPALGSDGLVYFGQEFGRVYALKALDGSLVSLTYTSCGITWSSPAIDSEGVLYISDLSGKVYGLQTGSKGLDKLAQWPKFRCDNQNGGGVCLH
jgi:outer membrane protein assembly factor BamB